MECQDRRSYQDHYLNLCPVSFELTSDPYLNSTHSQALSDQPHFSVSTVHYSIVQYNTVQCKID